MIGCTYCDRTGYKTTFLVIRTQKIAGRWRFQRYATWDVARNAYLIEIAFRHDELPDALYCNNKSHNHPIPKREYIRTGALIRPSDVRRMRELL